MSRPLSLLLALVLGLATVASPAVAVLNDGLTIEPSIADNLAVHGGQNIDIEGQASSSAPIDRVRLFAIDADGDEVVTRPPDEAVNGFPTRTQYIRNDGGRITGTLTLDCVFSAPTSGCQQHDGARTMRVEVKIGDELLTSNVLPVDYTRPTIRDYRMIDTDRLLVEFTEAVRHRQSDLPDDWEISDPVAEVLRVEGPAAGDCRAIPTARTDIRDTGCTRILVLDRELDEDAQPDVDYRALEQEIPGRSVHDDHASNRVLVVEIVPTFARDLVRPALPKITKVEGRAVTSGSLVGAAAKPTLTVENVSQGHTVHVVATRPGGAAPLVGPTSGPAPGGPMTVTSPDLSTVDATYTLQPVVKDKNGNLSTESSKNPPRADGSPATVDYIRDSTAPKALLAVGDGPFVTVEFDDEVLGANRPAEWKLTTGGPVTQVSGSGLSRLIKGSSQASGRISYAPDNGAGDTLRDQAGNQVGAFSLDILSGRTVLANTPTTADEGKALGFVIRLASAQDSPITASYTTQDGTGVAGLDYVAKSGSVTFQPGETQKFVSVTTLADDLDEDDETVVLRLTSVQNGEMTSKADRATGTILDGDPLPEVDVLDVSTHEGTTARVKVRLDAVSGRNVTVKYATANGTALAGSDFGARSGTLTIAPGKREGEIVIPIEDDGDIEPTETFTVRISDPVNAELDRATATVTILDGIGVEDGIDRVDGPSRTETSAEISKTFWDSSDVVVIATADAYPDALAGAPLASKHAAPILLTGRTGLHPAIKAEVTRLGATKAFVLGGAAALSSKVDADLRAAGVDAVTRVSGKNRFETAQRIAERVGGTSVYLVEGANADPARGWPDAVAVSALAAAQQRPILLTEKDRFPGETRLAMQRLKPTRVEIVGGTQAVNAAVAAAADREAGTVTRISGRTRYETSAAIAEASRKAGLDPENTWVATGDDWPDSLSASPAVARTGGILILVDSTDLNESPPARAWAEKHTPRSITVVGGVKAISQKVFDQLRIVSGL